LIFHFNINYVEEAARPTQALRIRDRLRAIACAFDASVMRTPRRSGRSRALRVPPSAPRSPSAIEERRSSQFS
jgi:hypothetical protein